MTDQSAAPVAAPAASAPPVWLRIVAVAAMLWFLMDSMAFFMRVLMT